MRYGSQVPTFTNAPETVSGAGDAAADLFEQYGVSFYESQRLELRLMLARDESGDYGAKAIYISKPRQNGKSYAAQFYAIWCAAVLGLNVLFTAHRVKTVRKMFKAIKAFIESTPDFKRALMPHGIYNAFGYESINFVGLNGKRGGVIEFQTRSASGARGESHDVIIADEAQEMTVDQQESLLPTSIASSDVSRKLSQQVIYLGTPPGDKCIGTVFRDAHDKAHAGVLYGAWWLEWAVDEPVDTSNPAAIIEAAYLTNPAMGYRIRESSMLERGGSMTPEGFAREHCGWWATYGVGETVIAPELWRATETAQPPRDGLRAYAVKFEQSGQYAALAVAVKPQAGACHVELVRLYDTTHGLEPIRADLERASRNASEIVIDGGGYAQALIDRLTQSGVQPALIKKPVPVEVSAATSNLLSCLSEKTVTHYANAGQELLDDSATKSLRRPVGKSGYSFASTKDAYAEPIEAAALALLFVMKTKRNPKQKAVLL